MYICTVVQTSHLGRERRQVHKNGVFKTSVVVNYELHTFAFATTDSGTMKRLRGAYVNVPRPTPVGFQRIHTHTVTGAGNPSLFVLSGKVV